MHTTTMAGTALTAEMKKCRDVCSDCHDICLETVSYCPGKGGKHAETLHICCWSAPRSARRARTS